MKSVIVGTLAGLATVAASASCAAKSGYVITFYGYPDNHPAGAQIS